MINFFRRRRLQRVKDVWGESNIWTSSEVRHWLQLPLVQRRINAMITGDADGDRYQYFLQRYLKDALPVDRAVTLGCGSGELERGLAQYNFAKKHEGIDISDDAVRNAQIAASSAGLNHITYRVADLNSIQLEPQTYDIVFAISSIHHVENLEHLFEQVRGTLKPGGYIFMDEYVGPSRFQWTDQQLRLMNEQLSAMPAEFRRSASQKGTIKDRVIRKTLDYMRNADPSEAVRSAEILPLLSRYFGIVEMKGYGGSLLHELLFDIAGNFDDRNPDSVDRLQKLFELEDAWIENGTLNHDFAVVIARNST